MDLEERIARLIDPDLWDHDPQPDTYDDWHRGESIRAARRVIDGLHLEEEHVYSFDGDRITHVLGQIHEEDTLAAPHEWADVTTYADSPNRVHIDTVTGEARTEEPE